MTIDYSRVLRKLANQRGKERGFTGLPVSLGEHSSPVGTDVFCDRPFPSAGIVQAGEVELDWERFALLNSRIGTLQAKNLPLRTLLHTLRTCLFA
jgi:hypothetical protein